MSSLVLHGGGGGWAAAVPRNNPAEVLSSRVAGRVAGLPRMLAGLEPLQNPIGVHVVVGLFAPCAPGPGGALQPGPVSPDWNVEPSGHRIELVELVTEPDGSFRTELTVDPQALLFPPDRYRVFAVPREAPFQRRMRREHQQTWIPGEEASCSISLTRGGTLTGRLLGPDGEPARAGGVRLCREVPEKYGVRIEEWDRAHVDLDGRFELDFYHRGSYRLQARAPGLGTAEVRGLELDPGRIDEPLEVVVEGAGALSGLCVDPEGRPVPGIELVVAHENLLGLERWRIPSTPAWDSRLPEELLGRGLLVDRVRADEYGRFRAGGLVPGRYFFTGEQWTDPVVWPELHATGCGDVEVAVGPWTVVVELPEEYRDLVDPADVYCHGPSRGPRIDASEGEIAFSVLPGETYAIGCRSPSLACEEQEVFVPRETAAVRRTLAVRPAEPGRLVIRVRDAGGAEYHRLLDTFLLGRLSGSPLYTNRRGTGPMAFPFFRGERVLEAMPGAYELLLEPDPQISLPCGVGHENDPPRLAAGVAATRVAVEVPEGGERVVEVQLRRGSRITLDLDLEHPDNDPYLTAFLAMPADERAQLARRAGGEGFPDFHVDARLFRGDGTEVEFEPADSGGGRDSAWRPWDGPVTSWRSYEPGRYRLVVRVGGYRTETVELELEEGVDEAVALVLERHVP